MKTFQGQVTLGSLVVIENENTRETEKMERKSEMSMIKGWTKRNRDTMREEKVTESKNERQNDRTKVQTMERRNRSINSKKSSFCLLSVSHALFFYYDQFGFFFSHWCSFSTTKGDFALERLPS